VVSVTRFIFGDNSKVQAKQLHIALVGNPNSGKSSLFNCLTGLNQKVGNFPGVTVDKKTGVASLPGKENAQVIDLPGTYSLYPRRQDEWVSYKVLLNQDASLRADMVVAVADASSLKRNLLFCTQIIDLKVPVVIALTMMDLARRKGIKIDIAALERELGVPVVAVNPRKNKGIAELKKAITLTAQQSYKMPVRDFIDNKALAESISSIMNPLIWVKQCKRRLRTLNKKTILILLKRRQKKFCNAMAVSNT
jgi:ferrous iron transport protein B